MIAEKISSLESAVSTAADEKQKADAINQLAFEIRNSDTQRSISLCKQAQKISSEINYPEGKATALANEGFCYVQITNYELALEKSFESLQMFEELKHEKGIALSHYNLCLVYSRLGDYSTALDHASKSLTLHQKNNNTSEIGRCLMQIGFLYFEFQDYETSIEYYNQGLQIARETKNQALEAALVMGFGHNYLQLKEYEKSRECLLKSLEMREHIKDWRGYAAAMNAYLTLCYETKQYAEGEKISLKGIKLATELGDNMGVARYMNDLGKIYLKQNKIEQSEKTLLESLQLAERINLKSFLPQFHFSLSEFYESTGSFEKSLQHYKKFHELKEELLNTNAAMKAKSIQMAGKVETAQKEAEINRLKNVELKKAYQLIEEKNKDITDSINYAKRIQQAILAREEDIKTFLPDSFLLYKPKDIVAGDFYFFETTATHLFYAACDCTGHGVPGALVSVVCSNALTRCIREFQLTQPGQILDKARELVLETFKKSGQEIKDGMDISLCTLELPSLAGEGQGVRVQWSGANNPLWYFQNNQLHETNADVSAGTSYQLIEVKADKQPIGKTDQPKPFTTNTINIKEESEKVRKPESENDALNTDYPPPALPLSHSLTFYLFTDGYPDQFGGPKGKKFKYKQLEELLVSIQDKTMSEQREILNDTIEKWKGSLEQVDDICVIGVRV